MRILGDYRRYLELVAEHGVAPDDPVVVVKRTPPVLPVAANLILYRFGVPYYTDPDGVCYLAGRRWVLRLFKTYEPWHEPRLTNDWYLKLHKECLAPHTPTEANYNSTVLAMHKLANRFPHLKVSRTDADWRADGGEIQLRGPGLGGAALPRSYYATGGHLPFSWEFKKSRAFLGIPIAPDCL